MHQKVLYILINILFLVYCSSKSSSTSFIDTECRGGSGIDFNLNDQMADPEFSEGTTQWKVTTYGNATVYSYPTTDTRTDGHVGLLCYGGATSMIEVNNPITISTTSTSMVWDIVGVCIAYKASTAYGSKIAGRFWVEMKDYWGTEVKVYPSFDVGTARVLSPTSNWMSHAFQWNPALQDWLKIGKLKLIYAVPGGVNEYTEIWISQVDLVVRIWKPEE